MYCSVILSTAAWNLFISFSITPILISIVEDSSPIGMKFSNTLRANQVDEWKENYISYELLKSLAMKSPNEFKRRIDADLRKINDFFFLLEKRAVVEREEIFNDVDMNLYDGRSFDDSRLHSESTSERDDECLSDDYNMKMESRRNRPKIRTRGFDEVNPGEEGDHEGSGGFTISSEDTFLHFAEKEMIPEKKGFGGIFKISKQLERRKREKNLQEFLHAIISIKRFREINYTGLVKLSKKYDKIHPSEGFHEKFIKRINESYFNRSKRIDEVYKSVKELYRNVFARDDPDKVRTVFKKLKINSRRIDPVISFLSGIFGGISVGLIALIDFGRNQMDKELFFSTALLQYGAFLFGLCLVIFKRFHVNYKFIFNFDICSSLSSGRYLLLISLSIFINAIGTWMNITFIHLNPYWILLAQLMVLIIPWRILHYDSRFYLLLVISRIILFPFSFVRFRHFYFADVGQSLTFCLKKILFYGVDLDWRLEGCINSFFPAIRFIQCLRRYKDTRLKFPHIANALKYTLSILVGISIPLYEHKKVLDLFVYKVLVVTLSSICSSSWDIFMDWGIIRGKVIYPRYVYGIGALFNLFCRFSWISSFFFDINGFWLTFLEITRRFVWTVFRVEFEHLNNCSEFETKGSISLTSRELFYKRDYDRPNESGNESGST